MQSSSFPIAYQVRTLLCNVMMFVRAVKTYLSNAGKQAPLPDKIFGALELLQPGIPGTLKPWSPRTLEFWGPWKRWSLPCSHEILEAWNLEAAKRPRQLAALAGNNLLLLGCKAGLILKSSIYYTYKQLKSIYSSRGLFFASRPHLLKTF